MALSLYIYSYCSNGKEGRGHLASLLRFYEVVILFSTLLYLMSICLRRFFGIVTADERLFGNLGEYCRLSVAKTKMACAHFPLIFW